MANFHGVELETSEELFRPTTISEHCAKNIDFSGKKILDLGCGVGPLAIYFALNGARAVSACDVVPEHIELAKKNAEQNSVNIDIFESDLFSKVMEKFEVICCDVSGVDKSTATITGWFPENVPTADESGADLIVRAISEAGSFLVEKGLLYVCGTSFSDVPLIEATFETYFPNNWEVVYELDIPFSRRLKESVESLPPAYYSTKNNDHFWQFRLYRSIKG